MQGKHLPGRRIAEPEPSEGLGFFGKAALILLITILVLGIGGAAGIGVYANHIYEGVFPGVTIADIPLAGKTLSAAQETLETQLSARLESSTVTVSACGEVLGSYNQKQLGAQAHAAKAALDAYNVGREEGVSGWISNALLMAKAVLGSKTELALALTYDEEALRAAVNEMADKFFTERADAFYELSPEGLFVTKERSGRELDRDALAEQLRGAEGAIEAPWTKSPGQALDLYEMADELSAEALPARYDIASGTVLDGQVGVAVDVEAAQYVMDAAAEGERVQLPAEVIYPQMTAEELEAVLFRDLLSTATTSVSGTKTRKSNVKLSGEFVNGTVLNHGDIFDYNETVGERTVERGFGEAAAYRNGETVQELGGGICQTSSTLYYATLLANLEIVQRANHRFYPGYIELGMDATVSWGGPEFRFRNDTGYPIKIEVVYQNDKLTINIYGTKTDDTYVVMTHEVLSVTEPQTIRTETMDLLWGTEQTKQSSYTGYKVQTYRNVYDGEGNLISSTPEARSNYSSRDKIILVGINGRPSDTGGGSVETGGSTGGDTETGADAGGDTGTDTGTQDPANPGDDGGSGETEDPGIIDPEDEMPDWLRPQ